MRESGRIISNLRKEAGFTQKTLAQALNVTDKAVSKWERGISLPDAALLPKLSLLLDADVEHLIAKDKALQENWIGIIDFGDKDIDFSKTLFDKPAINYFLIHYYLLGIREIYIATSAENRAFLDSEGYTANFNFHFEQADNDWTGAGSKQVGTSCEQAGAGNVKAVAGNVHTGASASVTDNAMIFARPLFLWGSDLTRKFQGAMTYGQNVKLVPENCEPTTLFRLAADKAIDYEAVESEAITKTLGRGVVCIDISTERGLEDASSFVEIYQRNTGLKIAEL